MVLKSFRQGGGIPGHKNFTKNKAIEKLAVPLEVSIPLLQHIGAPCEALVKIGDRVKVGQLISEGRGLSAPIHSSVSGVVTDIAAHPHCSGKQVTSVMITTEGSQEFASLNCPDIGELSSLEIVEAIGKAGIVGMGGAGFPTKVKLSPPSAKPIDTIILNGVECEPFLTVDHRIMVERADLVIFGLKATMTALNAEQAYIGIEDNKPDAIAHMVALTAQEKNISVIPLKSKYPQGGEKQLIYAILQREVPSGGLPMDVGVVVQNVSTAAAIAEALLLGKPLIERVVTVSGPRVPRPGNYVVRIGTSLSFVLQECGVTLEADDVVVAGGPMTGMAQPDLAASVIKTTGGVLVFPKHMVRQQLSYHDCVRCGKCVDQCPSYLYPHEISIHAENQRFTELDKCNILDCIECGLCSYVCPAHRPIVQFIKLRKPQVMQNRRKLSEG